MSRLIYFDDLLPEEIEKFKNDILVTFCDYKVDIYKRIYQRENIIYVNINTEWGREIFENMGFKPRTQRQ